MQDPNRTLPCSIEPLLSLGDDIGALASRARGEGFLALDRLVSEWSSGANRFDGPGEVLLAAMRGGSSVGVCGLNCDPYSRLARHGRLRHLYVSPAARRLGLGRRLVDRVVAHARGTFEVVRLRTDRDDARAFYLALGFEAVDHDPLVTHRLVLTAEPRTSIEEAAE